MSETKHKRVIGVAGEIASGTTTFAEYAQKKCGAFTTRYSVPLRDIVRIIRERSYPWPSVNLADVARRLDLFPNEDTTNALYICVCSEFGYRYDDVMKEDRDTLQRLSTILRQTFGEDILAQTMIKDILQIENNFIIVEGMRRVVDFTSLRELPEFLFVYIDTTFEERYRRHKNRKQYKDEQNITLEEFQETCNQEAEQQIRGLKEHADIVIDTNPLPGEPEKDCLERYHARIRKIIEG